MVKEDVDGWSIMELYGRKKDSDLRKDEIRKAENRGDMKGG